ncbi:MAG: TrpB-like pyridoxal phosphate-dependent enzyme [Halobacteriales archaeon]
MARVKYTLEESELPTQWYNVLADLPGEPAPPLDPETHEPMAPEDLAALFPRACIEQEVSTERWIDIPDPVRDVYRQWRPTPLYRARSLEAALDTPAKIFFKYEGVSPAGSHKPNTAVAQAYYNQQEGTERIATETGAGQWGSALAYGANTFDLDSLVYMVKVSYEQKADRVPMMQMWNADVRPSPTEATAAGREALAADPDSPGSLGIAIAEAVEEAAKDPDTKYALGSVLNHVLLHQTVIGQEAKQQFEQAGVEPDVLVGVTGGGSSFGGFSLPFVKDVLAGERELELRAVEPTACPTLTKGEYRYDFGDSAKQTPLMKMYTLGHTFVPPPVHAGGLRYHGMAPIISALVDEGVIDPVAVSQLDMFEAAVEFSAHEGFIPGPEPGHAIYEAIEEAKRCRETGEEKVIAFLHCGHGYFDMGAYREYFAGELEHVEYSQDQVDAAMAELPDID